MNVAGLLFACELGGGGCMNALGLRLESKLVSWFGGNWKELVSVLASRCWFRRKLELGEEGGRGTWRGMLFGFSLDVGL